MSLCIPRHMTFRPPKSCGHQAWNPYSWYLDGGLHREVPTSYHLSHRVSATMQSTFRMSYFFKFWFSLHLDGADALDNISISQIKKKTYRGWLNNSFQALTSKIGLCKIKIQTTGWYSPCQNGYNVTQNGRVHSDSYRNWFQVQGIPNRKDRILPTKPEYIYPRRKLEVTVYCLDQTVPTKTPCFQSSWYDSNTLHFLKNVSLWGSTFASFRIISTENPHPVLGVPELGQQICRMMRLLSCTLRFLYHCLYVF